MTPSRELPRLIVPIVAGADLSGLRSFAQAPPDVPRVVVCEVAEKHQMDGTDIVPWRTFFERFEGRL